MLPQKGKGSSGNLQNELTWLWEIHLKSKMGEGSWPFHKSLNTILLCKQVSQTAHHGQKCILLVKICTKLDWKNVHNSRKLFCQLRPSPHPHKFSSKMLLNGPFYPSHIPLRKTNYILVQICTKGRSPGPNLINFRKTSKGGVGGSFPIKKIAQATSAETYQFSILFISLWKNSKLYWS